MLSRKSAIGVALYVVITEPGSVKFLCNCTPFVFHDDVGQSRVTVSQRDVRNSPELYLSYLATEC